MTHLLLTWGYLALLVATFVSSMGIPTGSELVIAYAGALASGDVGEPGHHLNVVAVIVVATVGEILGSFVGYGIGRVGGRPLVDRVGRYVLLTKADLDRAERLFDRHGEPVVFFARLVPLLRSFVALAAGLAEMSAARFALFTGVASAMWCAAFALLGDALGSSWARVLHKVSDAGYAAAALFVIVVVALVAVRLRTLRAERALGASQPPGAPPWR
jgi:membrane protein DedA with SNARE-associated domain